MKRKKKHARTDRGNDFHNWERISRKYSSSWAFRCRETQISRNRRETFSAFGDLFHFNEKRKTKERSLAGTHKREQSKRDARGLRKGRARKNGTKNRSSPDRALYRHRGELHLIAEYVGKWHGSVGITSNKEIGPSLTIVRNSSFWSRCSLLGAFELCLLHPVFCLSV